MTAVVTPNPSRNRNVGLLALAFALSMLALGYAAVPLYRMFCQVTGLNGTTQRVTELQASQVSVAGGDMIIRFDANTDRGMGWKFKPQQVTQTVKIGARSLTTYVAENISDKPITGQASFNVQPERAGKYFSKVQCFCFVEQTLQPGEQKIMPVQFYVDPRIKDDPDAKDIGEITLSYTFHPVASSQ